MGKNFYKLVYQDRIEVDDVLVTMYRSQNKLLILWMDKITHMMSRLLTRTATDHLELDDEAVRDTDGGDLKSLSPFATVFRTFFERDFSCIFHNISHL